MINEQLVLNLQNPDHYYNVDWAYAARHTKGWISDNHMPLPCPLFIKEVIDYNPDTGEAWWKERPGNNKFNSTKAGKKIIVKPSSGGAPRHQIGFNDGVNRKKIYYSRVVWCWIYGEWPDQDKVVDHIDGDYMNNRKNNLRLVTRAENSRNLKKAVNNSSGHSGVSWHKPMKKWIAKISVNGKEIWLGSFDNKEDAIIVRKKAEIEHGYHKNHGRS